MAPLREARSWTSRYNENEDIVVEPLRRYYLIFEGAYTEVKYFEGIDNNRKVLGINNFIELVILHKDGEIKNYSNPKKLFELIDNKKEELKNDGKYDEDIDHFVIVFDKDIFKIPSEYMEFVNLAKKNNILAVTNPCFELWLLLHYDNSVQDHIMCNQEEILQNRKVSNKHTFMSKKFADVSGFNSKTNLRFERLLEKVSMAIEQEKLISQEVNEMAENIGSNIGVFIE